MADIGLGNKCNECCTMCTNIMPLPENYKEPATEQIIAQIDRLDRDIDSILLTGGEPTIRKDLFQILEHINKNFRNTRVRIITNSRMFYYRDFVEKMKKVKNLKIITELYGSTPELHDSITNTKGSFQQTFSGIINLLDNKFTVELRIVISKLNYKDILNIANLYKNKFRDAEKIVIFPIDIIGNAFRNRDMTLAKYTEIMPYVEKAVDLLAEEFDESKIELYHIPYCLISEKYWKHIKGMTVPERRIFLDKVCRGCVFEEKCPRIWKSYAKIAGTDELNKIMKEDLDGPAKS